MEKLHYKTLEAAVKKYGQLPGEGKTEAEIKAAISSDEKGFTPEQVEEIFAALPPDAGVPDQEGDKDRDANKGQKGQKGHETQATPAATDTTGDSAKRFVVVLPFRDKNDFSKQYAAGDDVSHFDKQRLDHLVKIGRVSIR